MRDLFLWTCLGALASLAGCASAPAPMQPEDLVIPNHLGLHANAAAGQWAEVTSASKLEDGSWHRTRRRVALVGQQAGNWQVEIDASINNGWILALEVDAQGKVATAWAGKPGSSERLPLHLEEVEAPTAGDTPPGQADTITVKAGTFGCRRVDGETPDGPARTWSGTGEAAGLLLKVEAPEVRYELASLQTKTLRVGAQSFRCRVARYDNGEVLWRSAEPAWFGRSVLKLETPDFTLELSNCGDDARPALAWPGGS